MTLENREKDFFDTRWQEVQMQEVQGQITVPEVENLEGKRILICSCGYGKLPVYAAKQGAETYAFDISETAVENARNMAEFNGVKIEAEVMNFHNLAYKDEFFDIVYGSAILHHVDCSLAGREILRVLKPGGVAYFLENSDRNPILRYARQALFGKPGGYQRQQVLFFKRLGTTDEYPLTDKEIAVLADIFDGNLRIYHDKFNFFTLLNRLTLRNARLRRQARELDDFVGRTFPGLLKYSFNQEIFLRKPG